jgi:uncharacterized protein with NRDE domain
MCVVALAVDCHPRWRLLLAANRDEFHSRDAAPLAHWDDVPHVIAGRDLVAGGSWLGVSEAGRLAVLTNIRDADGPDPKKLSRGALVADWLANGRLPHDTSRYNGFSLILADGQQAVRISNRPLPEQVRLTPGIHGLSNGLPHEPWRRRDQLESVLGEWIAAGREEPDELLALLADEALLDSDGHSIFIRDSIYGTRCSTVIAVDHQGHGHIIERRFGPDGVVAGEHEEAFIWQR